MGMASQRDTALFYGVMICCSITVAVAVHSRSLVSSAQTGYETLSAFDAPPGKAVSLDTLLSQIKTDDRKQILADCRMLVALSREDVERDQNGSATSSELVRQFLTLKDRCGAAISKSG